MILPATARHAILMRPVRVALDSSDMSLKWCAESNKGLRGVLGTSSKLQLQLPGQLHLQQHRRQSLTRL